jgi:hypothetical protein
MALKREISFPLFIQVQDTFFLLYLAEACPFPHWLTFSLSFLT